MTVFRTLLMTATCLPMLSLSFAIQQGSGADSSTIENELSQERQRLEQLQKKITETKIKATKVKKKRGSVLKNIEQLDRQLYRKKKERNRIDAQLKEQDQKLANLNTNITEMEKTVQTHRTAVTARLRLLYIEGRTGYLKTLFTAKTFADAANRMDYITWVAQREHTIVRKFP